MYVTYQGWIQDWPGGEGGRAQAYNGREATPEAECLLSIFLQKRGQQVRI